METIVATYGSNREAKEHADRLNDTRQSGESFGCKRTVDGRWHVIRVVINRHGYNAAAVDNAIASSNRHGRKIGNREASMIHALMKGR